MPTQAPYIGRFASGGGVSISGIASDGETLTANIQPWTGSTAFTYQWNRDDVAISGATSAAYNVTFPADEDADITVTVTTGGVSVTSSARRAAAIVIPNRAPTVSAIPNQSFAVNAAFAFNVATFFADPDGDTLTYSTSSTLPSGVSLSSAGVLSGTPTAIATTAGIVITATDPDGLSVNSAGFDLEVTDVATITHVVIYGQSLSLGSATNGTDAIISGVNTGHRMFNGGVRAHYDGAGVSNPNTPINPESIASFVNLQEQASPNNTGMKETFASGIALKSSSQLLLSATGRGAYRADQLSRLANGVISDTNHFQNTYATVLSGSEIAKSQGLAYQLGPVIFKQGEADGSFSTTKSSWKSEVNLLASDFKNHLRLAGHVNTDSLKMIVDQQAIQQTGRTYGEIAVAAIELHREGGDIVCAGPTYTEEFAALNEVHMTSNGYRNYGEKLGLVVDTINSGGTWNPCHITSVSRAGMVLTVNVHVPTGPLVTDTTLVASVANSGFQYSGANITQVTISDDGSNDNAGVITIVLDAAAAGVLNFAYENGTNQNSGPISGPRGNIRDSESAVTLNDGKNLYNWLCNDSWSVA